MEGEKALWEEEEEKRIKQCEHPGLCFFLINATFYSYSVNLLSINIWNRFDLNLLYASHLCVNVFTDISFQLLLSLRSKDRCGSQPASLNQVQERRRPLKAHQSESYLPLGEWKILEASVCFRQSPSSHHHTPLLSVTTFICPLCLLRIQTTAPASSGPSPPRP